LSKVSVVTRSKNESKELRILAAVLKRQSITPSEVIVVDNNSEDDSRKVAAELGFSVISTESYFPGNALNLGIEQTTGEFVVLVSSHCIPASSRWLENLIEPLLADESVVGVYGRQLPSEGSTPNDSRDLYSVFGSESKLQTVEIFFHNANSAIRKSVWNEIQFSNTATNIEDRIWAKEVLSRGHKIFYSSKATVFHPHGINHNGNESRARSVVKVMMDRNLYEHEKDEDWYKQ
jgi:rhamnosyltransferase